MYIINLFFVPVFTVYLLRKNCPEGLTPSLRLLCLYAMSVAANVVVSYCITLLEEYLFHIYYSVGSPAYTLTAVLTSFFLVYLYRVLKARLSVTVEKKEPKSH